ncbi:Per os infectivity factor 7 [Trabala vishnou gigantina nucleopolyhedrovirus]|uniref:Per os infectivity factor 7 n=1 Tax=Trabala vishnou gigantina nucleopolyhedrovirus TaxID=2863583 RepID=UPI002481E984|nr:Per os infectivity factor 7 [Trabala vishnou gigantina nucleopolyhedrovirus]QYC92793.1 Per os infectivity factor 7 [Trabala vishnou gigantina nucleopolyhedrovirus]
MFVYIIALVFAFVMFVTILITLRLNRNQTQKLVYFQYNYIPEPLVGLVKVRSLKHDLSEQH